MRRNKSTSAPLAFSYVRFSSPEQAKGDSLRRQIEKRNEWIKKSGAVLDESITLRDEGVSAFKGDHRQNGDRHALAAFLSLVERGRVPRGSYLIVESLDRLSREQIRPALTLVLRLIEAGIRVVQLLPVEAVYDDSVEPMALMQAIMELSRGHSESKMKSERVGAAWNAKKRRAAIDKEVLTNVVPSWLKVTNGKIVEIEANVATVRQIFDLACAGYGNGAITKKLNETAVRPIGRAGYWARSFVHKILNNRAVLGECQPHTGRGSARKTEGKPILGYFPAIVSEDKWHAAHAAILSRKNAEGRPSADRVNLFAGLWRDARDGGSLHLANKGKKSSCPVISGYKAAMGIPGSKKISFPLPVFEDAILSKLREIDPSGILEDSAGDANKVQALTGKLASLDSRIEAIKGQLVDGGEIASLVDVLRRLEESRKALAAELADAKREAATPMRSAWSESRNLLELLRNAPDVNDTRVKLRALMRQTIEGMWCLFVASGSVRLAAVQIHFSGGAHRDYLIVHRSGQANAKSSRAAETEVLTFFDEKAGPLDFRKPAHAARLEPALQQRAEKLAEQKRKKRS